MNTNEHDELAESMRNIRSSVPSHTYVERGISRRDAGCKKSQPEPETPVKTYSDYRRERDMDDCDSKSDKPNLSEYGEKYDSESSSRRNVSMRRFQNRQRRAPRPLAEDEQPPLIDAIRDMATRKSRQREDFNDRYDRSRTGASKIEHEKINGGSAVMDVEYFVPKVTGENAVDINYGAHKRRTHNKKPMRMWKKASLTAVSLFLVFLLCLGMGFNTLLDRMNFVSEAQKLAMQRQNDAADAEAAALTSGVDDTQIELPDAIMFDEDIENILLIGSDTRSATTDSGRSDAMMMLTIDRKHNKIKLTSFLRDLYIKIPNKYGAKLNAAYAVGGVELTKSTIEANLGITIDKYVIVDFTAFKTVVDKIGQVNGHGGIKMTVTAAEANYMCNHETYGLFPRYQKGAGTYYMTGAEALNYARIRKIDSDFGRVSRQRKVLAEIIEELKDLGYMDLISLVYSCLEYVTTDISKGELVGLATEASEIMNYEIKQISIPINGSYKTQMLNASTEVIVANLTVNAEKLAAFIYDDNMTYEGNEKKIVGIYIPDIKGIAGMNVTTKSTTTTTAADGSATAASQNSSGGTVASKSTKSTTTARAAG